MLKNVKLPLVVIVFIAVFLAGVGVQRFYLDRKVMSPLTDAARSVPGVADIDIIAGAGGKQNMHVRLDQGAILEDVYPRLLALGIETFGLSMGQITIEDHRNSHLEETYHDIHYALYEGASTGRFTAMMAHIEPILSSRGLTHYRITVDGDYVYVALDDGDAYLYALIPRHSVGADDAASF